MLLCNIKIRISLSLWSVKSHPRTLKVLPRHKSPHPDHGYSKESVPLFPPYPGQNPASKSSCHNTPQRESIADVTEFLGQVYSIKNALSLEGKLWIVPTEHFLNFEVEDGYLGTMYKYKQIDVEDIQHNEHYNIYCTDEQSARKFLTPTVIEWFNSMTSRRKLSFYINESRIYFANYNDKYFFAAPDDKKKCMAWRMEDTARKISYAMDFANEVTEMIHKSKGFS